MGRQVFLPYVSLHFHDSGGTRFRTTSSDEPGANEASSGLNGVFGQ
jgi:hypothetical protein